MNQLLLLPRAHSSHKSFYRIHLKPSFSWDINMCYYRTVSPSIHRRYFSKIHMNDFCVFTTRILRNKRSVNLRIVEVIDLHIEKGNVGFNILIMLND